MANEISNFKGIYFFLSNYYSAPVTYKGITFQNNEAAFQAMKCPALAEDFTNLSPDKAKKLGRNVKLRNEWETIKNQIMYEICLAKFTQNSDLKMKLLATGTATLIEGNDWGDRIWGVCNGVGENRLGKILMTIREELRCTA